MGLRVFGYHGYHESILTCAGISNLRDMDDINTTDVSPPTTTQVNSCIDYGRYCVAHERREEYDRDCLIRES